MKELIKIEDGVARQEQYQLHYPINITLAEGEQLAIVGDNAAGKSIVVRSMTGAIPLKGIGARYNFKGERRTSEQIKYLAFKDSYGTADRGYYHQQRWNSFDREDQPTVEQMLPQQGDPTLRTRLFSLFRIDEMLSKEMILLSSGELRKFQLTKALLSNPKLLILEDPFIGLDAPTRDLLRELLAELVASSTLQLIMVLSKSSDLADFITHVVEVIDGQCMPKRSYVDFLSQAAKAEVSTLTHEKKAQILALPASESAPLQKSIIELNNITIVYGEHTILKDLSWQVSQGEQWVLTGENGAGKSTLLSLICADIPQGYSCDLSLFGRKRGSGESIWDIKRHIGYVSPEMHRAYNTSAAAIEIVASGLHDTIGLYKRMRSEQVAICEFWMDVFGIKELRDRDFMQMSSGEQRLVLLSRAFVKDPALLILDEPLHGLDSAHRQLTLEVIESFCSRPGKSLIYVSHYPHERPKGITHSLHLTKVR